MTELLGDSLMVLLQRIDRRSYDTAPDLVNGCSYRWVASGVSIQSLTTKARQLSASHEHTQLCHFQICALDGGSLEPISVEALDVPAEATTRCRTCLRDLPERYYDSEMRTGTRFKICMRCQDAASSRIPTGHLSEPWNGE